MVSFKNDLELLKYFCPHETDLEKILNIFEKSDGHLEIVNFKGHRTILRKSNSWNRILRKISYKNGLVPILYKKCSPGEFYGDYLELGLLTNWFW